MINNNSLFCTLHRRKNTYSKLIVSGKVVEYYKYEYPIIHSDNTRTGRANQTITSKDTKELNRAKTRNRAKREVRRLINANSSLNKFITLTFENNIQDINFANKEFKHFIQRLNYTLKTNVQYITVIEFQKRGAIHYHMLSNAPYIDNKTLNKLWGNGFVRINKIDNVDNVGAYVTKYMSKDLSNDKLIGKKCYFTSKNLNKPTEITDENIINELLPILSIKREYNCTFNSEYNGNVTYKQMILYNDIEEKLYELYNKRANIFNNLKLKLFESFRKPFEKGLLE